MKNKLHKWVTSEEYSQCSVCGIRRRKRAATTGVIAFEGFTIAEYFIDGKWQTSDGRPLRYCNGAITKNPGDEKQ